MELLCPTAIFKKFEFLRQFSKKQSMIKKNYLLRWTEKFVDKARQCFAFLHIKPIIIYSRVKLIPWNVVNLSHLYLLIYIFVQRCEISVSKCFQQKTIVQKGAYFGVSILGCLFWGKVPIFASVSDRIRIFHCLLHFTYVLAHLFTEMTQSCFCKEHLKKGTLTKGTHKKGTLEKGTLKKGTLNQKLFKEHIPLDTYEAYIFFKNQSPIPLIMYD